MYKLISYKAMVFITNRYWKVLTINNNIYSSKRTKGNTMFTYYWKTEESHFDNTETMNDYLNIEMDPSWLILEHDGAYAEILTDKGHHYALHASGDGDSFNHKITFEEL